MQSVDGFYERINQNDLRIAVIGLGYVGLPLAATLAESGLRVTGVDKSRRLIDSLSTGTSYIPSVSNERLQRSGLSFSEKLGTTEFDVYVICVPTPLDEFRRPDMRYVKDVAKAIDESLWRQKNPKHPKLVVLESTVWPGATREIVQSAIACPNTHFAFAPERENPGDETFNTRTIPRVVGADTDVAREMASVFYGRITTVHPVSSTKIAESAKLLENIYRLVNIALVNELRESLHALDVDIREVIEAAATKPFGFQAFWPGPGIGGHCIPIDPFYLTHRLRAAGRSSSIIEAAGEIVASTPEYVVRRISDELNARGEKSLWSQSVCVLGVAYKPNISDARESPAQRIISFLFEKKALVQFYDPYVQKLDVDGYPINGQFSLPISNIYVLVTDHDNFDYQQILDSGALIFDTRDAFRRRGLTGPNVVVI